MLAGILLPAIQAAREGGRRIACANNLKQLGWAVHSYESAHGRFPPSGAYGFSVFARLLPYIDQVPLSNSLNFYLSVNDPPNIQIGYVKLEILECPSNNKPPAGWPNGASTSYAANVGFGTHRFGDNGALPRIKALSFGQFTDGTSNTAALAEWVIPMPGSGRESKSISLTVEGYPGIERPKNFDKFVRVCDSLDPTTAPLFIGVGTGNPWVEGALHISIYNHDLTINRNSCGIENGIEWGAWTAKSYHSAGAHVCFADGHVRYLSDSVSLSVWRALGSRDGGEVAPDP